LKTLPRIFGGCAATYTENIKKNWKKEIGNTFRMSKNDKCAVNYADHGFEFCGIDRNG
jgi:hypothetical protein